MSGFDETYWKENYSEPMTMDCIGNAKQHVAYMHAFLGLEFVDISTVIDLGFGMGVLFRKALKQFLPHRACGIEPSLAMFKKADKEAWRPVESTQLSLHNESIEAWCKRPENSRQHFDLGICTSVFQYLSEENLQKIIPVLSKRIKYLYLTVPTDLELSKQRDDLNFHDRYAIGRSREFYMELMRPHFTLVSSKFWESKYYFNEETTNFSDLLYRN